MTDGAVYIFLFFMLCGLLRNFFFFWINGGGEDWNVEWMTKDRRQLTEGDSESMPDAFAMSMMMEQD